MPSPTFDRTIPHYIPAMTKPQRPAQGFGPPHAPAYWVQVVHENEDPADIWKPVYATPKPRNVSRKEYRAQTLTIARDAAGLWLGQPGVDYVLILRGTVAEGDIAEEEDIIDTFHRLEEGLGAGCKVWTLQTKAARSLAGLTA